ncbi:hypothetical protein OIE66_41430 [Nonomuraea sp. NBC_01738]|uniref:hypothetical protein n=1 Tax=Nonomuraea sp. NBC_01738 TaxID=2976003 RepID=UPI002E1677F5|nr:hypothetical protein OIE66_41430 [Nonomuraea sp. NBC_01738]
MSSAQLAGREPLPDPLPGGARLFGDQVAALAPAAREVAEVAAVESDLAVILRATSGRAALAEAEASGLLQATGTAVRFRHPLIRAAILEQVTPARRREIHATVAELTEGDRRAWHRAAAQLGPSEPVAEALTKAATQAAARGGYGDAAAALARAADLTPGPSPGRPASRTPPTRPGWAGCPARRSPTSPRRASRPRPRR